MISKELFKSVIKTDGLESVSFGNEVVYYNGISHSMGEYYCSINVYELINKMKQWAKPKGYTIYSAHLTSGGEANLYGVKFCEMEHGNLAPFKSFHGKNEYEAVFKACEFILKDEANEYIN